MSLTSRVSRRARRKYGLKVYSHHAWGSRARNVYRFRRRNKPVSRLKADTLVQHITVTRRSGDIKADARTVERIGLERFNSGVSYNFLVDMKTGEVAVGQPLDAKGTHTVNDKGVSGYSRDQNAVARAIAVVGMPDDVLSQRGANAISGLIAAMIDKGALTPGFDYDPHSKFAWKDCPCNSTRNKMGSIRKRALALRGGGKKRKPKPNRVVKARQDLAEAVHRLKRVPKRRKVVHKQREAVQKALKRMPER